MTHAGGDLGTTAATLSPCRNYAAQSCSVVRIDCTLLSRCFCSGLGPPKERLAGADVGDDGNSDDADDGVDGDDEDGGNGGGGDGDGGWVDYDDGGGGAGDGGLRRTAEWVSAPAPGIPLVL